MNVLEIKNVVKTFSGLNVLNDVSLTVKEGETVVIIGASGSGKSTLLRCINNLEKIDKGRIYVDGKSLIKEEKNGKLIYSDRKTLNEINLNLGMIFQDFNLFPHLSVLENITKSLEIVFKKSKEESEKIAISLLKKMDLESKKDEYPCNLSGGQKQRVSIARSLALSPKLICMDEPTSALDPELVGEVLKVIKDLAKEKRTMVIVTHEIKFAEEVADRIIFMDGGKIIEEGTPEEIMKNPKKERTKEFLKRYISLEGENVEYIDDKYLEENELLAKEVIKFFKEISDIPRMSGNEEKICEYLVEFAKKRNLEYVYEKEAQNVIIRKENESEKDYIAFQAHTDMICEKEPESNHDFLKDPIKLIKDGDFIKADKTSLGADNGLGVAYMLALLDSKEKMPNIECIFTSEEETTMKGAINLNKDDVKSKTIISLDNGKEGKMTISAANCMEWFGMIKAKKQKENLEGFVKYTLEYSNFLGGHSGGNIADVKRGNPIKLAGEVLNGIDLYIESLSGGSRVNVIPRDFKITFFAKEGALNSLKDRTNKQIRFFGEDGKIVLTKEKEKCEKIEAVYSKEVTENILGFINSYDNGALEYSDENSVILSSNFAAVKEIEDGIRFEYSLRSNNLALRDEFIKKLNNSLKQYNIKIIWEQELKGFEPNFESTLVKNISKVYKEMFNEEMDKVITQGVLEGGFFKSKIDDLDYVCIGANTYDVHSPKERFSIKSVQKVWKLLWQILKLY